MIYHGAQDWLKASRKRVALFGMSGLGKTHVSRMLRAGGDWFHYSVDYRIGTRYLGEEINDELKHEAMNNPRLAPLLRADSLHLAAKLRFDNLAPLSAWMGKPGRADLGGLPINEYRRRQALHRTAEIAALRDSPRFIARSQAIYDYAHFICDTGGSFCEVVAPQNPDDPVLRALADSLLLVWIEGSPAHEAELIRRFDAAPKPMYYQPEFLDRVWGEYLSDNNMLEDDVNPDDFIRHAYGRALAHRQPLYRAIAENWGVTVPAQDVAALRDARDFDGLIADALARKSAAKEG